MSEPTPRQVLYALVAAGILGVVAILIIGAAAAGLVPTWWTGVAGAGWLAAAGWGSMRWRSTGRLLAVSIGFFAVWVAVTLAVAG